MPENIRTQFIKWAKELKYLGHIIVPRWLGLNDDLQNMSVHTFTDTSEKSCAAVVFVRAKVQLVQSKTKMSSLLCACGPWAGYITCCVRCIETSTYFLGHLGLEITECCLPIWCPQRSCLVGKMVRVY